MPEIIPTHHFCGCKITHNPQPDKIFRLKNDVSLTFSVCYNLLPHEYLAYKSNYL